MENQILTNLDNEKLLDTFSGELLDGKIQVQSNRGYLSDTNKPQQDAVLSIVKNDKCFLNIVADGAGGSADGALASAACIEEMGQWFLNIKEEELYDINNVIETLTYLIRDVDMYLWNRYHGCYSTIVLALTINDKTIIANVGDSTAYTYNAEIDDLELLSTRDSWANDLSYEDARWSSYNNVLTAAIGDGLCRYANFNVIDNNGQRIILSSDGVTDLVSDETFISYFTNNSKVDKIINDAINNPEVFSYEEFDEDFKMKSEDNVSAIIIDLPGRQLQKIKKRD